MIGAGREQFGHASGAGADIEQRAEAAVAERLAECGFDRAVGGMEQAQRVPFLGVAREPGLGAVGAGSTDRGKVTAVLGTACGERGVVGFGDGEQPCGGSPQRRRAVLAHRLAHEHPAAFLAPFRQPGIAQDADMARNARLALAEHLRQFADRQFHGAEQAHDAQPGVVGKRAQEGVDLHGHGFRTYI